MVPYIQSLLANFVSAYYLTTALQHGRHKKKKKNQLLLVSSTPRPNLLCFGFDFTQSQSSKPISRNGYDPNCFPRFRRFPCFLSEFSLAPCDSFLVSDWTL